MKDLYTVSRRLYETAFPGEPQNFVDRLFALYFPRHLRLIGDGGEAVSMLFSIPYAVQTATGTLDARYLYAVATAPAYRGKGYAKRLIGAEIDRGLPVFLRPMSPALFDFYGKAGLSPFSPVKEESGEAAGTVAYASLSPEMYRAQRGTLLQAPFCAPSLDFLKLAADDGGAVSFPGGAALYERQGDVILFKEWLGDPHIAPALAAALGGKSYRLRRYEQNGTPFGVCHGLPPDSAFLLALD